jgi:hypothetical protein
MFCSRTFEINTIHANEFILNPEINKSQGKGTEIFNNQVKQFKDKGFKNIETTAAKSDKYNGYYTWARLGYEINSMTEKRLFESLLKKSTDKRIKSVQSLQELMTFKEGRDFWKKNGFQFEGKFDLKDNSKSMFILNNYVKEKQTA